MHKHVSDKTENQDINVEPAVTVDMLAVAMNATRTNAERVDALIESAGMGVANRDSYIVTSWTTFPAPALYDDGQDGENDIMLGQGPWFDLRDLEEGGIVQKYDCDG